MSIHPARRAWHITFGTYASRNHDDDRPTVDRRHNLRGEAFPSVDPDRHDQPGHEAVKLTVEQCLHVQRVMPQICKRGSWTFHACAAPIAGDHVHVLLDAHRDRQPKAVRMWLKRWLGESLSKAFAAPPPGWWAEGGSTKPVEDERYLRNVIAYIERQRR